MTPRRAPVRLAATLTAVAFLTVVAGCGGDDASGSGQPSASASLSPSPSRSSSPSASASASDTASASASPSPTTSSSSVPSAPGGDLSALLLPASRLPGFNDVWRWSQGRTGPQRAPLGICQRFPMDTLGATSTVVRHYVPTGDEGNGTAAHLVSHLPDEKSVAQAVAVLRSFHDRCKERLGRFGFSKVGPVTSVRTSKGTAWWYLVTYSPQDSDEGHFDALGVLSSGRTVELVRMDLKGFDYNYARGQEPVARALRAASTLLP